MLVCVEFQYVTMINKNYRLLPSKQYAAGSSHAWRAMKKIFFNSIFKSLMKKVHFPIEQGRTLRNAFFLCDPTGEAQGRATPCAEM